MTEKITCPTCGYAKLEVKGFRETGFIDGRGCPHCECIWDEHMRQPPLITPEMAWEWFCEQLLQDGDIEKIFIGDDKCIYINVWRECGFDEEKELCEGEFSSERITKILGWQDMPERVRRVCDEK